MSRQSKMAGKAKNRIRRARYDKALNKAVPTSERGPARTTPLHGKKNRWPYDAEWRKQRMVQA